MFYLNFILVDYVVDRIEILAVFGVTTQPLVGGRG